MVFNVPTTSDYSQISNALRVQGDLDLSSKVALTSAWQLTQRSIVQTTPNPFVPLDARGEDRSSIISLGGRWAPLRSVLVGCDWAHEKRRASGPLTSDLDDHTISCYGQFQLQL
jgi:hypothetical protein